MSATPESVQIPAATVMPVQVVGAWDLISTAIPDAESLKKLKRAYGILDHAELRRKLAQEARVPYLVDGLIRARSVNIVVGDSGIGKTPFLYQLGLCVAAGVPFLGHPVQQGRVLYLDYENGLDDIDVLLSQLTEHLRLPETPDDFLVWSYANSATLALDSMVRDFKPALVFVDSLRSYHAAIDDRPKEAAQALKAFRALTRHGTGVVGAHHLKKETGEGGTGALEDMRALDWLLKACGPRALVNQSDGRFGLDEVAGAARAVAALNGQASADSVALVFKGHIRVRGEFEAVYLKREHDEQGEPLGYTPLRGVELLFNGDQQACFAKLPEQFTFKQAKQAYGRADSATKACLNKCQAVRILRLVSRGVYAKTLE